MRLNQEMGLNYQDFKLPNKTLVSREEVSAPITNATGNFKLKFVLIGKSAKRLSFRHVDIAKLAVIYKSQQSAWIDSNIFYWLVLSTFCVRN